MDILLKKIDTILNYFFGFLKILNSAIEIQKHGIF